ncbi:hypothetical protein GCM10027073_32750 [Streptomyces chlorus]|uniref:Aconitate hydratase n=1 Tax=Streptomyces chlorus TaxID=887452 RepID=A0ABW1E544_9ACTN
MPIDTFAAQKTLSAAGSSFTIFRLDALPGTARLPYSLKVLLENLLRNEDGRAVTADQITALVGWAPATEPATEIQFTPARVPNTAWRHGTSTPTAPGAATTR